MIALSLPSIVFIEGLINLLIRANNANAIDQRRLLKGLEDIDEEGYAVDLKKRLVSAAYVPACTPVTGKEHRITASG